MLFFNAKKINSPQSLRKEAYDDSIQQIAGYHQAEKNYSHQNEKQQ